MSLYTFSVQKGNKCYLKITKDMIKFQLNILMSDTDRPTLESKYACSHLPCSMTDQLQKRHVIVVQTKMCRNSYRDACISLRICAYGYVETHIGLTVLLCAFVHMVLLVPLSVQIPGQAY